MLINGLAVIGVLVLTGLVLFGLYKLAIKAFKKFKNKTIQELILELDDPVVIDKTINKLQQRKKVVRRGVKYE